MEVTVEIPQKKTIEKILVVKNDSIATVIKKLGYNIDAIVVLFQEKPIPETTEITEDMDIKILEITSKG